MIYRVIVVFVDVVAVLEKKQYILYTYAYIIICIILLLSSRIDNCIEKKNDNVYSLALSRGVST